MPPILLGAASATSPFAEPTSGAVDSGMHRTWLLLCLAVIACAHAQSSSAELQAYAVADAALDAALERARDELPSYALTELRADQQSWLEYRDERSLQSAVFDGAADEGAERSNEWYWRTRTALTETRTRIVEAWIAWYQQRPDWNAFEGVWSDGYGGTLIIEETGDGSLHFLIEVVRGPTYHVGGLSGSAERNGRTARFSTPDLYGDGDAWLTFIRDGMHLRVVADNADAFHGARAYFDGEYLRLSDIDEAARTRLDEPTW